MTRDARVLVVDDEDGIRFGMAEYLRLMGYEVAEAASVAAARDAFRAHGPDAVVLDFQLPDGTALDLLPRFRADDASVPVIVLTGHGSIDLAVRCVKEGADQFLTKPVELPALVVVLDRVLEHQRNRRRSLGAVRQAQDKPPVFLGTSAAVRRLEHEATRAAQSASPVLLLGETGSGKGVLARWLHEHGARKDEPFVDINCAGLSRELLESELFGHEKGAFTGAVAAKTGLLEVGHRGTLFLDEIGDMDPQIQPKLLKVLEEKQFRRLGDVRERRVDVRLVSATHQDLEQRVADGRFRSDLYFRVSTVPIRVPALRERREDIVPLAQLLLERLAGEMGRQGARLAPEAAEALEAYHWPGNIRELRNVLERALLFAEGPVVQASALRLQGPIAAATGAPAPAARPDLSLTLEELERRHVRDMLAAERGHVERAARRLGIPRSTLYQKLKRFQIDPKADLPREG